jgi:hypothetical protein
MRLITEVADLQARLIGAALGRAAATVGTAPGRRGHLLPAGGTADQTAIGTEARSTLT